MIEEESLEEFSGAGMAAGFISPMSIPVRKRSRKGGRKSKLKESMSLFEQVVGSKNYALHNHFRYFEISDSYYDEEPFYYYDSVRCASKSFGGASNPFGDNEKGKHRATAYLQGKIKYPHEA